MIFNFVRCYGDGKEGKKEGEKSLLMMNHIKVFMYEFICYLGFALKCTRKIKSVCVWGKQIGEMVIIFGTE